MPLNFMAAMASGILDLLSRYCHTVGVRNTRDPTSVLHYHFASRHFSLCSYHCLEFSRCIFGNMFPYSSLNCLLEAEFLRFLLGGRRLVVKMGYFDSQKAQLWRKTRLLTKFVGDDSVVKVRGGGSWRSATCSHLSPLQ